MSNRHDPDLLDPLPRERARAEIGISGEPPFTGVDLWNAYEVSWLAPGGKPRVAIGSFVFPATSPRLIESKSMKLYLNSFNQASFTNAASVIAAIERDLAHASGAPVSVDLGLPREVRLAEAEGESIDGLEIELQPEAPDAGYLQTSEHLVEETLTTNLLKTNCPLTGQPDWASLRVRYRGPLIVRESLLRYVVSFRLHRDFHEHCVERIFMDVLSVCRPEKLTVEAHYTRRGGIDINPFRTNRGDAPSRVRTPRQ